MAAKFRRFVGVLSFTEKKGRQEGFEVNITKVVWLKKFARKRGLTNSSFNNTNLKSLGKSNRDQYFLTSYLQENFTFTCSVRQSKCATKLTQTWVKQREDNAFDKPKQMFNT